MLQLTFATTACDRARGDVVGADGPILDTASIR
jgi:hypothetical protein